MAAREEKPASTDLGAEGQGRDHSVGMVVCDFDWSLVHENSDTWIIKQLAPELEGKVTRIYYFFYNSLVQ